MEHFSENLREKSEILFVYNLDHSLIRTLRGSLDDTEYYSHVTLLLVGTITGLFLGFFTMSCQWIVSAWHRNLFWSTYTPPPRISVGGKKGDIYWSVQCLRIGKDALAITSAICLPVFHINLNTYAHAHVHWHTERVTTVFGVTLVQAIQVGA